MRSLDSIKQAAKTVATDMITYYNDRDSKAIPGKLDGTWWEGGSMFMILIQYWFLTGDSQFNALVQEGMYWQKGDDNWTGAVSREGRNSAAMTMKASAIGNT